MLFVIHLLDKSDRAQQRAAAFDAHLEFLKTIEAHGVKIVMSGPLVADEGSPSIGSHFIVEAADRKTVEAFHHADPFYKADIWHKSEIHAFIKRIG